MKFLVFLLTVSSLVACTTAPRYYIQEGGALQEVMAVEENDDMVILQKMGQRGPVVNGYQESGYRQDRVRVRDYEECDQGYYEEEAEMDDFSDCQHRH